MSALLPRFGVDELRARWQALVPEEAPAEEERYAQSPGGDSRALRGIPAIGHSVDGAIPGTRPDLLFGD
ncbi:MAG TPA: hypothetical protein VH950_04995 [Gaiellaceae bacterium]|jgi:hypothetical protein